MHYEKMNLIPNFKPLTLNCQFRHFWALKCNHSMRKAQRWFSLFHPHFDVLQFSSWEFLSTFSQMDSTPVTMNYHSSNHLSSSRKQTWFALESTFPTEIVSLYLQANDWCFSKLLLIFIKDAFTFCFNSGSGKCGFVGLKGSFFILEHPIFQIFVLEKTVLVNFESDFDIDYNQ